MEKNFFEKNSKLVLIAINLLFVLLLVFVLRLPLFQDSANLEKYSLIDKIEYQVRCQGKRHIVLRENEPNQVSYRIPPYDPSQKISFRTNEDGFVEPSKIHENPDLVMAFLGGSTTECEMVDELNRFPYLVGRILEEKTGKKINSYNGGKSGNNLIHTINNSVNKVAPLHPQIVVRMENINDLSTLLYEGTYWNRNKSRSNLGCFSKNNNSLRNFGNEWAQSPFVNEFGDPIHQKKIRLEHYKTLKLFVVIVKGIGAKPVLMTQANRIDKNPDFRLGHGDENFSKIYRQTYIDFHNITRLVAKEENALLIDLAKEIPGEEKYLYDSVHFTNEGSKLAAKIIAKKLEPLTK